MPPDTIAAVDLAGLSAEQLRGYLRQMYLIRLFEEQAEQLYIRGLIHGTMHLSIGQEASAVGACAALQPDDYILSTHRGHGHCIAKGARIERMMAEFMGKETGYCRGRGGSMSNTLNEVEDIKKKPNCRSLVGKSIGRTGCR